MSRVAIVGVGAVGGFLAAQLIDAGHHELVLCSRTPFERLTVSSHFERFEADVTIETDPSRVGPVDWVLLATKAHQTPAASAWLEALSAPSSQLAVFQNGIDHAERLAGYPGGDQLVPAVVWIPLTTTSPGQVELRADITTCTVPDDEGGRALRDLFLDTPVDIALTDDWVSAAWNKLCLNIGRTVCVLTERPLGVFADPVLADFGRRLVAEAAEVGRAEGALIGETIVEMASTGWGDSGATGGGSLWRDRVARRPMEWEARNGIVVERAARHGIDVPSTRLAVSLLRAMDAGSTDDALAPQAKGSANGS